MSNAPSSIRVLIPTPFLSATEGHENSERDQNDGSLSKTTDVKSYSWANGAFTLIDTPGFADTSGPQQDDANVEKILEFAAAQETLNGIILVVNGTRGKMVSSVKTVISRLRGNIPDIALNNIIYVVTNCESPQSMNLSLDVLPFKPSIVCYMNNSAFSSNPSTWKKREKVIIERNWEGSFQVIQKLIVCANSLPSFPTHPFAEVLAFRRNISTLLENSLKQIAELAKLQDKLSDIEANVNAHKRAMDNNRNFKYSRTTTRTEDYYEDSYRNCHHCDGDGSVASLVPVYTPFGIQLTLALTTCRSCGGRGRYSEQTRKTRSIPTTVEEINHEMRNLFQNAEREHGKYNDLLAKIKAEKAKVMAEIANISKQVEEKCNVILPICSRFSFRDECEALLQQLETTAVTMDNVDQKQATVTLVRSLKELANNLEAKRAIEESDAGGGGCGGRDCVHIVAV